MMNPSNCRADAIVISAFCDAGEVHPPLSGPRFGVKLGSSEWEVENVQQFQDGRDRQVEVRRPQDDGERWRRLGHVSVPLVQSRGRGVDPATCRIQARAVGSGRSNKLSRGLIKAKRQSDGRQGHARQEGAAGTFIGMTGFGASGPAEKLYEHFNMPRRR